MAQPQTHTTAEREYVLGTNREELLRLGLQHQLWARYAADAWERAGFGPGKKLLDVGCGPGYASLDLAARVGTRGQVRAIDISERFIRHLQSQAQVRGLTSITASVGHVERLNLSRGAFDGALCPLGIVFCEKSGSRCVRGGASAEKGRRLCDSGLLQL